MRGASLYDLTKGELTELLAGWGEPTYRARQVWDWLYRKLATHPAQMTNLPAALRNRLVAETRIEPLQRVYEQRSTDRHTIKWLFRLGDGQTIETVLMLYDERRTVCISSQAGCAMGCVFCATGQDGLARNLTTGEIVEEMLRLKRLLPTGERLSHVVVMGMGEPLANLDRLLPALEIAGRPDGLGIGARRITISTVGLPKGIRRLADLDCQYHLAVSLHAPSDEIRNRLIPANRKIGVAAVLEAADYYFDKTGRRVTFEYVLLAGLNDGPEHAQELAALLQGRPALVNLIPYNPVAGLPYHTPKSTSTARFAEILQHGGLTVAVRYRKGDRIDAACGQLRRRSASL